MKNYNSKENKYKDIKSIEILGRAKHCQYLQIKGKSVKEIAEMYKLSESRINNLNNETDKNNDKRGTAYGCSRFN